MIAAIYNSVFGCCPLTEVFTSVDESVKLWSRECVGGGDRGASPVATLSGHSARLSRVVFHGLGAHLISSSFDTSWRLWDLETRTALVVQDGHARPVYGLAVHPDGSLLATGDLAGNGRIWDLRTGHVIAELIGHIKQILSIDFSSNGQAHFVCLRFQILIQHGWQFYFSDGVRR